MADGGKNKKYKRMKMWCEVYRKSGRWEKNRKRRMLRHLRNNPNDLQGIKFYSENIALLRGLELTSKGRKLDARARINRSATTGP